VPVVGQPCQGEGTGATWSSVILVTFSQALFVNDGALFAQIWP
jgi:hypothetical protein